MLNWTKIRSKLQEGLNREHIIKENEFTITAYKIMIRKELERKEENHSRTQKYQKNIKKLETINKKLKELQIILKTKKWRKMPIKDKEKHALYMREYRRKIKEQKNKGINQKGKIVNQKSKPLQESINVSKEITQEEKEFLRDIIIKTTHRRSITQEESKKALKILYK